MKKFIILTGLFIATAFASHAQSKYAVVVSTLKLMGYSIGQEWNCPLKEGQYFTKTFSFTEGTQFDIVALSEDGDVKDVDMDILTPGGYIYDKDTRPDAYAEVNFTPSFTRDLTIKVTNSRSYAPSYASTVYFIVAYKD